MRATGIAAILLLIACSSSSVAAPAHHPSESAWRADIRADIKANGWESECAEFVRMTPQERGTAAAGLVLFGVVETTGAAVRYIVISAEECNKAKP